MKLRNRLSVGLVAMLAVAALSGPPAVAADSPTSVVTEPATREATTTESSCAITRGGKLGHYICGTGYVDIYFGDGRINTFIIGLDHAVWNIVQYAPAGPSGGASNWASLGGWVQRGVKANWVSSPGDLGIWAYGAGSTGGRPWCRNLIGGRWYGWYACVPR